MTVSGCPASHTNASPPWPGHAPSSASSTASSPSISTQLIREKTTAGLTLAEATSEANREFGSVSLIAERGRDARGVSAVNGFIDDARYGVRLLLRTPGFLTVASLALAIGIGATAATLAGIALVLARPLPFPAGDRLVAIWSTEVEGALFPRTVSMQAYHTWQSRSRTRGDRGVARRIEFITDPNAGTFRVQHQAFTPSLFRLLGVVPHSGQIFEPIDDPYMLARRRRSSVIDSGSSASVARTTSSIEASL